MGALFHNLLHAACWSPSRSCFPLDGDAVVGLVKEETRAPDAARRSGETIMLSSARRHRRQSQRCYQDLELVYIPCPGLISTEALCMTSTEILGKIGVRCPLKIAWNADRCHSGDLNISPRLRRCDGATRTSLACSMVLKGTLLLSDQASPVACKTGRRDRGDQTGLPLIGGSRGWGWTKISNT